jgi:hypothetical protein
VERALGEISLKPKARWLPILLDTLSGALNIPVKVKAKEWINASHSASNLET